MSGARLETTLPWDENAECCAEARGAGHSRLHWCHRSAGYRVIENGSCSTNSGVDEIGRGASKRHVDMYVSRVLRMYTHVANYRHITGRSYHGWRGCLMLELSDPGHDFPDHG